MVKAFAPGVAQSAANIAAAVTNARVVARNDMAASTISFAVGESSRIIWLHRGSGLFYLNPELFHQPAPLLFIGIDIGGIGLRRAGERFGGFRCKALLDVLGGEGSVKFPVESRNDGGRCAGRRHQPVS